MPCFDFLLSLSADFGCCSEDGNLYIGRLDGFISDNPGLAGGDVIVPVEIMMGLLGAGWYKGACDREGSSRY
jgi:hypothetical protein